MKITLTSPILKMKINIKDERIIIADEIKSAKNPNFNNKLYIKYPNKAENAVIEIIIKIVFKKSKPNKFLLFNIVKFKMHDVIDIKIYPIINA